MKLADTIHDFSQNLQKAANRAADTVEHTANFLLEHNPLQKELSLLQQAARNLPTLEDSKPSKIDLQKVDEDLHKCGLLPHLHIGLDEDSNVTVKIDKADRTDCFGYMHAPGFWDQVSHDFKKALDSHNHIDDSTDEFNHDVSRGANDLTPAAKHVADTVIDTVGSLVKSIGVTADPRD